MKRTSIAPLGVLFSVLFLGKRSISIFKLGFWKEPKGARSQLKSFGYEEKDADQVTQQQRSFLQPALGSWCACSHLLTELLVGELLIPFQTT